MTALTLATPADAAEVSVLQIEVADHLTSQFGVGAWSSGMSEASVLFGMKTGRVYVRREGGRVLACLRLTAKKPWAIDKSYFTPVPRPLYLMDMAVHPSRQRRGVGRDLLDQARTVAREWPADAIRLDAYDAEAGAGEFYRKSGFTERGRVTYRKAPLIYFESLV
jgi:GNAT superfamily N-acetyltransferase